MLFRTKKPTVKHCVHINNNVNVHVVCVCASPGLYHQTMYTLLYCFPRWQVSRGKNYSEMYIDGSLVIQNQSARENVCFYIERFVRHDFNTQF